MSFHTLSTFSQMLLKIETQTRTLPYATAMKQVANVTPLTDLLADRTVSPLALLPIRCLL